MNRNSFLTVIASALLPPFLYGLSIGFSSPAVAYLLRNKDLYGENVASVFSSILTVSFMFGALPGGKILTTHGSRKTMVFSSMPFLVGWSIVYFSDNVSALCVGRILTGVGSGIALIGSPAFISEVCLPDRRGLYGSAVQLFITIGILSSYLLGAFINWKRIALIGAFISAVSGVATHKLLDSPHFLVRQGDQDAAKHALSVLRSIDHDVDMELTTMSTGHIQASVSSTVIRRNLKPLLLTFGLMFFQQANGINTVMYYTETIFISAGFEAYSSYAAVTLGVVQVLFTLIACYAMDKYGRKQLLIIASILMALSSYSLGFYYIKDMNSSSGAQQSMALWSLVVYIIGFSLGWGPVPLLMMAELFSVEMQGFASAMSLSVNTIMAFVVTGSYVPLSRWIGEGYVFMIYGTSCIFSLLFTIFLLIESKGKTRNQILDYFDTNILLP